MTSEILARYGPGLLYGRNTIMSFLDDFNRVDIKGAEKLTMNMNFHSQGKRAVLIDELRELEYIRMNLKKSFCEMLALSPPQFPNIVEQTLPKIEAPFHILKEVIIPVIEKVSTKKPETIPKFLLSMNSFLSNNTPTEVWDVPEVSEKITQWMKKALVLPNSDQTSVLQFWLKFIKLRAKIEDVLVLASVWFEHQVKEEDLTLFPLLLSDVKLELSKYTFNDFIADANFPIVISCYPIMSTVMKPPVELNDQPHRKCAAYKGFLYVMDSTLGFTKLGTGRCGTIFGQTDIQTHEFDDQIPLSMAVCNNKVLVRFAQSQTNEIVIIDTSTLKPVGVVQSSTPIPNGPFTGFQDKFYIINQRSLYTYSFDGTTLTLLKTIEILSSNKENDFITVSNIEYANLFTDGIFMNIVYTPKDDSPASVSSFFLETGEVIDLAISSEPKMSSYVAFDSEALILIFAPSWAPSSIYSYSERYRFQRLFGSTHQNTGNPCLDLFNAIIPSTISKITPNSLNYNRHYVLSNSKPLYELIQLCFQDERYLCFLEQSLVLLTIHISQVNEVPNISFDLLSNIVQSKKILTNIKIELLRSLMKHGPSSLFDTTDKCFTLLQGLEYKEISNLFSTGFHDIFTFVILFLVQPMQKILDYLAENSDTEYPFLSNIIFTVLRGIFVKKVFSPVISLPLLVCITNCSKSSLPTLVPLLVPLIEKILELNQCEQWTNIILKLTSTLIQYTSSKDLQDFADTHIALRDQPHYIIQQKIDETPHPYENDMKLTRHYDFPGAQEITIEFDPKTYTEPGCDTLQIFSDPEMKNELTQKMSGRHPKWGSITTKSHHLTFHFCSDGSVTEWGYRAIITAKFIATRYFCSPNSYFDLSYSISEMLFSFAKSINDFDKNNGVNFNIPHDVLTRNISNERKTELKEILKDQIDTSILDFPTCLPSFLAALDYLVANNMFDKSLLDFILAPPEYMVLQKQNIKQIFYSLASFLMSNNFCELPESRFLFLIEAIKKTDDAMPFALSSLRNAENEFDSTNSERLLHSASYIHIAFQIGGNSILNEGIPAINKFLKGLSLLTLPYNSSSEKPLIEKSFNLLQAVLPSIPDRVHLLEDLSNSLKSIEINSTDVTFPYVEFTLNVLLIIPFESNLQPFLISIILNALKFNIPNNNKLISEIVEKYHVHTTLQKSPLIKDLLALIGKQFSNERPDITSTEAANVSPSFLMSKASIIRQIIEPDSLSELVPIIEQQDEATLGALIVLSQRYFPICPSKKVKLLFNHKTATFISADYQYYHLQTDNGNNFSIPAIDQLHFTYLPIPFSPIMPSNFPLVSNKFVKSIEKCLDGKYKQFALYALAEISFNSEVSFSRPIQNVKQMPMQLKALEDSISCFKHEEGKILYKLNKSTRIVSFKVQPSMVIGFAPNHSISNTKLVPIIISNSTIILECCDIKLPFESSTITIGLLGQYKQVFIQAGSLFILTQIFLSALDDPQPYFLADKPIELDLSTNFPSFLFYNQSSLFQSIKCSQFSHVYSNHNLYSILDDLYKPIKMQKLQFLPTIQKGTEGFVYLEITTATKTCEFKLINEIIESHAIYYHKLHFPSKLSRVLGIFISLENNFVFLTTDGGFVESTAFLTKMNSSFSLQIIIEEGSTATINNGSKPYSFDIDKFLTTFSYKDLQVYNSLIDTSDIPFISPSLTNMSSSYGDFIKSSEHFKALQFERPVYINTRNIVSGFVPTNKHATLHNVNVINDFIGKLQLKPDQIVSFVDNTTNNNKARLIAALQRIQNSLPEFISPLLFCKNNEMDEKCRSLLTQKRRDDYFSYLEKYAQYSIVSNGISRLLQNKTLFDNKFIQFSNTDDFIGLVVEIANYILPTDLLSGECNDIYSKLLRNIFEFDIEIFSKISKLAFNILTNSIPTEGLKEIIITSKEFDPIEVYQNADCIYLKVLPNSIINSHPILIAPNNFEKKIPLVIGTQALVIGNLFTIEKNDKNSIIYMKLNSFNFKTSKIAFALQLVNFMISELLHNDKLPLKNLDIFTNILHENILYPLFKYIQDDGEILFPDLYSLWYRQSIQAKTISRSLMVEYGNSTKLEKIILLSPELTASLTLIGLYYYANSGIDDASVRERTVNYLDTMASIIHCEKIKNYHSSIQAAKEKTQNNSSNSIDQNDDFLIDLNIDIQDITNDYIKPMPKSMKVFEGICYDLCFSLISPFGNKLQYLGKIGDIELPVLTTTSFIFLLNSQKPSQAVTIDLSTPLPEPIVISNERLIGAFVLLTAPILDNYLFINDESLNNSRFIKLSKTIHIRSKEANAKLHVIPIYKSNLPTVNDFTQIYKYCKELSEKLTIEQDAFMACMAQNLLSNNEGTVAILEDSELKKHFPEISPESCRYRINSYMSLILHDTRKFGLTYCGSKIKLGLVFPFKHRKIPTLEKFDYGENDFSSFFAKLHSWFTRIPSDLKKWAPLSFYRFNDTKSEYSIKTFLKNAKNNMFEQHENGTLIPNTNDDASLDAYQGFGELLGLRFKSGRTILLNLSKLVLKFAFGGEITDADLADSNYSREQFNSIIKQLEAIRIGVEAAIPNVSIIDQSNVFPHVMQLQYQHKQKCQQEHFEDRNCGLIE